MPGSHQTRPDRPRGCRAGLIQTAKRALLSVGVGGQGEGKFRHSVADLVEPAGRISTVPSALCRATVTGPCRRSPRRKRLPLKYLPLLDRDAPAVEAPVGDADPALPAAMRDLLAGGPVKRAARVALKVCRRPGLEDVPRAADGVAGHGLEAERLVMTVPLC